jgi:hypothetical protein
MTRRLAGLLLCCAACGGGVPLMHAAHAVPQHEVTFGAGFSGTVVTSGLPTQGAASDIEALKAGGLSPGIAPWVGARLGFGRGFDAGLIYTGRGVRVDGRKSFALTDSLALSLGAGASGLIPHHRKSEGLRVGGFGADLPILFGWRSRAEIYSVWLGARGGVELLRGQHELPADPANPDLLFNESVSGWHAFAGALAGLRVGLKHVFTVLEVDAAMHWAQGTIGDRRVRTSQLGVAPGGALIVRF